MNEQLLGTQAVEAVADEYYRAVGIRGANARDQPFEEFEGLRCAYITALGLDHEGLAQWCVNEARGDLTTGEGRLGQLPMSVLINYFMPVLALAYETGIVIGIAMAQRLAESVPEAPA